MIDVIRTCHRIVKDLRGKVSRLKTTQVNLHDLRDEIHSIVEGYFRTDRPLFVEYFGTETLFTDTDILMQDLLRLSQGRALRRKYLEILSELDLAWREIEIKSLPLARKMTGKSQHEIHQQVIIQTLDKICPQSSACYRQALDDLTEQNKISWRGTASELREALRELLDKLAPDCDVIGSPGFKFEDGLKAPTMKQKVRFILKSRRLPEGQRKQIEDSADVIDEKVGNFVRSVYSGSSASVHTQAGKKEIQSILRFVEITFKELLET